MRYESATVPAAVMPDRFNDDGFVKYLPLSASRRMGRLQKTGISQKTCQTKPYSQLSGKKAPDHRMIPYLISCQPRIMVIISNDKYYYGEN